MMTSAKPASAATARAPDAGKPGGRTSGEPATTENQNIISSLDVQLVQNLVERCLQLYMNQREVVTLLQQQTKIEPSFTSLVWQKLEEQNPEFFKAYYARLRLKDQIFIFNQMLERQFHAAKRARGFRVAGEEVGPAAAAGGSALEHGGAEAMPRVTLPTSDDAKHGHSPLFGDASHFSSPMPSEFPPPESDGLAPDAGASFFPRTFSLSELSVDLRDGGDGDLPGFAVHEEDAIGQIGLKRNFSDLSDL